MKKAQGLSLNTMAIAAIVLVVIIVTIAIFTGVTGDVVPFFKERTECATQANVVKTGSADGCYAQGVCNSEYNGEEIYGLGCEEKNEGATPYCCIDNRV